jgi:hypothetical protein
VIHARLLVVFAAACGVVKAGPGVSLGPGVGGSGTAPPEEPSLPPTHASEGGHRDSLARSLIGQTVARATATLKRDDPTWEIMIVAPDRYDAACGADKVCATRWRDIGHGLMTLEVNKVSTIAAPPPP